MPRTLPLAMRWVHSATIPARPVVAFVLLCAVGACTDKLTEPSSPLGGSATVKMPVPTVANTQGSVARARSPSQPVDPWTLAARLADSQVSAQWFYFRNAGNQEWYIVNDLQMVLRLAGTGSQFGDNIGWEPISNSTSVNGFPTQPQNFRSLSVSATGQYVSLGVLASGASSNQFITRLANSTNTVQWVYFQDTAGTWYVAPLDGSEVYALDRVDETKVYWQPIHNGHFDPYPVGPNAFVSVTPSVDHRTITFGALTTAGSVLCGGTVPDERDVMRAEYVARSVIGWVPECSEIKDSGGNSTTGGNFTWGELNDQWDDASQHPPWGIFTKINELQATRASYNQMNAPGAPARRIRISSGYRCPVGNESLKTSADDSRHMLGRAVDMFSMHPYNWTRDEFALLRYAAVNNGGNDLGFDYDYYDDHHLHIEW